MHFQQLEVNRSNDSAQLLRPAKLNLFAVLAAVAFLLFGSYWTVLRSSKLLTTNVASKLETVLSIETEAVRQWAANRKQLTGLLASDPKLASVIASGTESETSIQEIESKLSTISRSLNNKTCALMTVDGQVIANSGEPWLLDVLRASDSQFCETLASGSPCISSIAVPSNKNDSSTPFAIVVSAPIIDLNGQVVGFLGIGQDLGQELTEVLVSSRSGQSGETIAVTYSGNLISKSRFESTRNSFRTIQELDSKSTSNQRNQNIWTMMEGVSDYRGVKSVMAYRWLPELKIGLITKMDHAEANAPVIQVLNAVWTLFGLIILSTFAALFYRWYLFRIRKIAADAEVQRKRLGAYDLEEKIGEGGMGVVYRANHALMRRPTAVKILPPEKSSPEAIERFEREVRLTSQLKHPNTISIYDYGRTESGLFYYAMELLDGMSLERLVRYEDSLPDGRVISILQQAACSLREAHQLGLVHRDIKPANIMLCDRGGAFDTVKVLDFGMIREVSSDQDTEATTLSGTPIYMAPECFFQPRASDPQIDIFALGAVGFFLISGNHLINAKNLNDLIRIHQSDLQKLAKDRLQSIGQMEKLDVSPKLIDLISRCVSSSKSERPGSIDEFLRELQKCRPKSAWNQHSAQKWWKSARFDDESHCDLTDHQLKNEANFALNTTLSLRPLNRTSLTP